MFTNIHGDSNIFMPNFNSIKVWNHIEAEKIIFFMTVLSMLKIMLIMPEMAIKLFLSGGLVVL